MPGGGYPEKLRTSLKAWKYRHGLCLKQIDAYGLVHAAWPKYGDHQLLPCGYEIHADACEQACLVDKYVSKD